MTIPDKIESLRRLPWYSEDLPGEVAYGKGMIHFDERRMLYTLTRDYFRMEDAEGLRFWVYRDGLYGEPVNGEGESIPPKWFVHGLFA